MTLLNTIKDIIKNDSEKTQTISRLAFFFFPLLNEICSSQGPKAYFLTYIAQVRTLRDLQKIKALRPELL